MAGCDEVKSVVVRSNLLSFALPLILASFYLGASSPVAVNAQQAQTGTSVNATICANGSRITIDAPASDSVVTNPNVTVRGTVAQAGQIEVAIDGSFDSVVALNTGQTTYEAVVQIPAGTHTLKLTAVDTCQIANQSATSVITFTPPPSQPSQGSTTTTQAGEGSGSRTLDGAVVKNDTGGSVSGETIAQDNGIVGLLPQPLKEGINTILQWLNIAPIDRTSEVKSQLTFTRAASIAVGTYLLTIGLATTLTNLAAATPFLKGVAPNQRFRVTKRVFRAIGLLMITGGLFL